MIKLEVEDYCHECPCFEAETIAPPDLYFDNECVKHVGDTYMRCVNREQCERIRKYLKKTHIENSTRTENDKRSNLPLLYTDCSIVSSGIGNDKEYEIVLRGVDEYGKQVTTKPVICNPNDFSEMYKTLKRQYDSDHTI